MADERSVSLNNPTACRPDTHCFRVEPPDGAGDTLQLFRLFEALSETSWHLHVPFDHLDRWKTRPYRSDELPVQPETGRERVLSAVHVDHSQPLTAVGSIERPLVFSEALVNHLRASWRPDRPLGVTFAGLLTPSRKKFLRQWIRVNTRRRGLRPRRSPWGSIEFQESSAGRNWPGKAFDSSYFETLAASRYVLCPPGDYNWTYRVFEAALSGAIPILHKRMPLYEGLVVAVWDEPDGYPTWSPEIAEANFVRIIQLTMPGRSELSGVLNSLLT